MTTLPNDLDAERVVLGALMSGGRLGDAPVSSPDFYRPAHSIIFEAIEALSRAGKPADPVAVLDELRRGGQLGKTGGAPYLHSCIEAVPSVANAGHYAAIVREHAARRRLIEHAERIRQAAMDPAGDLSVVRELATAAAAVPDVAGRARRLVLTRASEIEIEPVVWAWEDDGQGRIPSGSVGLFAGREGTGKSSFLIWLTARITRGELPGMLSGIPRAVVYIAVEDSWKFTIAPRLVAAGADLGLVYRAEVQVIEGDTVSLSLPKDNRLLEEAITANDVALVALDPLMSAISDDLDTHVNRQVRQALDPLARLADRTGAVVAGIAHFNKSASTDASSLITASGAFKDVARFIFAFAADEESGGGVITQTKNSLGLGNLPSLAYRMIEAIVPTSKGDAKVGRFVLDGNSERTVADILTVQQAHGGPAGEKVRAEDFLRKILAGGPLPTNDVEEEAREAHQISKRTLERARQKLNIPTAKHGKTWWISLPEHEGDLRDSALPAKTANSAKDGGLGGLPNSANNATPSSPGEVGGLGGLGGWPEGSIGEEVNQ